MSLLSMCAETAILLNQPSVTSVYSNPNRFEQELLLLCEETGEELVRRHDWGELVSTQTYATTPGTLPVDYERPTMGSPVRLGTTPIRGALSDAEMNLKRGAPSGSPPRYLIRKPTLEVAPAPATTVTLEYVSNYWVRSATGSLQAEFLEDTDYSVIPEDIIVLGMKWRWRRLKGRPFDDELAEYEAAVEYRMQADRSMRVSQVAK
jgi:hypothetical protein